MSIYDFGNLSIQQIQLLLDLKVGTLIGTDGVTFIESNIYTAEYDGATATSEIQTAIGMLDQANQFFTDYKNSVEQLGIELDSFEEEEGYVALRVSFQR